MIDTIISPKKLIEVALPLDAINAAAAREKSIRHGHPSTLHLWWARRPLAAARAVIFSQLVHDPEDLWRCQNPGVEPNAQVKGHWTKARGRLFSLIEELVLWENTTNEEVLNRAREEIRKSWRETCELNRNHPRAAELFDPERMPGLHDPFAGGGTIPLEAQRLGLDAYASDLNPVAVLINKAMIEIPPKFAGRPPVNPESRGRKSGKLGFEESWKGAAGLAEDVRYYGQWMRDEAYKRIGHLYPPVEITKEMVAERPDLKPYEGEKLTVIAWLWARTVKSPNPAFSHVDVPLASTFVLGGKPGKESYLLLTADDSGYQTKVLRGKPPLDANQGTKATRGANFRCVMSGAAIEPSYIRSEATAGRMGSVVLAIVCQGKRERVYLSPGVAPVTELQLPNRSTVCTGVHTPIAPDPRPMTCLLYGMTHFDDLFTTRQLVALTALSDMLPEVSDRIYKDTLNSGSIQNAIPTSAPDVAGARAYAEAVVTYLAFGTSRAADAWSTLVTWRTQAEATRSTFARQALPIIWDYAEVNPFSESCGNWMGNSVEWVVESLECLPCGPNVGKATQQNAQVQSISAGKFVSTDPPYYDNVGYADLADFFYVWLRRALRDVFPDLMATMSVPKQEELVAATYRHRSKADSESFFLNGMTEAMNRLAVAADQGYPVTIYYAFKQTEKREEAGTSSTGWETFLAAIFRAGLSITGTWPISTEKSGRVRSNDSNALSSSIVLVCRSRHASKGTVSRRAFVRELNSSLPLALDTMTREAEGQNSPVAPVDLSQAIIGPGMAVFSQYDAVLEADGTPMSVKTALQLINRFLAEDDFDADTQFCLHWFEQYGWESGKFGEADTLARAKGTSVDGVKNAGVLHAAGGNVRLLKWAEYPTEWDPQSDQRLPVWEVLHQLIRVFSSDGESGAAAVYAAVQGKAEAARQLAYRLYTLCERKNWADDARAYNEVVTSWSAIETAAAKDSTHRQGELFA